MAWQAGGLPGLIVVATALVLPGTASGQEGASPVAALVRDLRGPDFERANAALERLGRSPGHRAQVIAGLIAALGHGDWSRCAGDMRDGIARTLADLKAKEAVVPLLELVRSGKPIEHECSQ